MNKKEVMEIKKRIKKDSCTFTKVCGCYVNVDGNKITRLNETFLNLEDDEMFKYMEIAKKVLSGKEGNNILTLDMSEDNDMKKMLLGLRDDGLKSDELAEAFYDHVIENRLISDSNYLILLFHDAYDVIQKGADGRSLEDSDEVYEYVLCAICPVNLSKPGLGYKEVENSIGARARDWVVGAPSFGFVYPAFNDRSADIHSIMYYTKKPADDQSLFMGRVLGCDEKLTAAQKQVVFEDAVRKAVPDEEEADSVYVEAQKVVHEMIPEEWDETEAADVKASDIEENLKRAGINENIAEKVAENYSLAFKDDTPKADQLINEKLLESMEEEEEKKLTIKDLFKMKDLLEKSAEALKGDSLSAEIKEFLQSGHENSYF